MTDQTVFTWWKTGALRSRSYAGPAIMAVLVALMAAAVIAFRDYWVGLLCLAFAVAAIPPLCAPSPRVKLTETAVEVEQRKAFLNSYIVFPAAMLVGAVGVTVQAVLGSPTGGDARLPYIAAAMWVVVALTLRNAVAFRGKLVVDPRHVSVLGRFTLPLEDQELRLVQQRKLSFPYLEFKNGVGGKPQLIFPTMSYGLEANSLYSTLRHLSEIDDKKRSTYTPALIRELLLYKPDRDVGVGDSIEVRVVARPTATAS